MIKRLKEGVLRQSPQQSKGIRTPLWGPGGWRVNPSYIRISKTSEFASLCEAVCFPGRIKYAGILRRAIAFDSWKAAKQEYKTEASGLDDYRHVTNS